MKPDPQKLARDPEFQKIVGADEELNRAYFSSPIPQAMKDMEIAVAAGGKVEIAGVTLPAPTAAMLCLLEIIDSPFISSEPVEETSLDVFRALYIMGQRENSAPALLRAQREQLQFELLVEKFTSEKLPPESLYVLQEGSRQLASAWADFDIAALEFGQSLGNFDWRKATEDLEFYLTLATGFSMIPHDSSEEEDTKKNDSTPSNG